MAEITVVTINRSNESPYRTLKSLAIQTIPFNLVIVYDEDRGSNWCRNTGASLVSTEYILFSDNDIIWEENALATLYYTLKNSQASYSYGWYEMEGKRYCDQPFNSSLLKKNNYISTMSLLRTIDFPGFDEKIERLQDWDLWLTLLDRNKYGIYCGEKIFSTQKRNGITFGNSLNWIDARKIVAEKHCL